MRRTPEQLFVRYRRHGRPADLARVYDEVAPELLDVALRLAPGSADAEDLLQETFATAIESAGEYDAERPLLPWLLGILANAARRAARRRQRRPDPDWLARPAPEQPADAAQRGELAAKLDSVLDQIPETFQSVLILRLRHGLEPAEIAQALRRPPGTVRSQLSRGLELLRERLPRDYAPRASLLFVGLGLLERPSRGLAGVREAVLAQSATVVATSVAAALLGVLTMKPMLAALGVALAVSVGVVLQSEGGPSPVEPLPGRAPLARSGPQGAELLPPVVAGEAAGTGRAAVESDPAPEPRERSASRSTLEEAATTGTVRIHATQGESTEPAAQALAILVLSANGEPEVRRSALTDEHGLAEFPGIPPGFVEVALLRGGTERRNLALEAEGWDFRLALHEGMTARGSVIDASGTPVPHAAIWLSERWRTNRGYLVASADAQGRFELSGLTSDHFLGARAPGFATSYVQNLQGQPGDELELEIVLSKAGAQVAGRVLDRLGAPIPGAQVLIGEEQPEFKHRRPNGDSVPGPPPQWIQTDAAGRFALRNVPEGVIPIQARARGYAPLAAELFVDPVRWAVGLASEVELVLEPAARVQGRVLAPDGTPLAAARISTGELDAFASNAAFSLPGGEFSLGSLPSGDVALLAKHALGEARIELHLSPAEQAEWHPRLVPVPRIAGEIVDEQGAALEGWSLVAWRADDPERVRARSNVTGPDGRFEIDVSEVVPHRVLVHEPEGWRRFPRRVLEDVLPGATPLRLVIPPAERETGSIVGRVVDFSGDPVPGAELSIWHQGQRLWRSYPVDRSTGTIEVPGVPPGLLDLKVRASEHPWVELGQHEVFAGVELDLGTVQLPSSGRLRVTLVDVPEASRASLELVLTDELDRWREILPVGDEVFLSAPLAPGRYTLSVQGDHIARQVAVLLVERGSTREEVIRVRRAGLREVVFVFPEGRPLPSAMWAQATDEAGRPAWLRAVIRPVRGVWRARVSLPPGNYTLFAASEEFEAECPLTLSGFGTDPPVRLELD